MNTFSEATNSADLQSRLDRTLDILVGEPLSFDGPIYEIRSQIAGTREWAQENLFLLFAAKERAEATNDQNLLEQVDRELREWENYSVSLN